MNSEKNNDGPVKDSDKDLDKDLDKDFDKEWEIDNLPNRLTLFRVALIPIIVGPLTIIHLNLSLGEIWGENLSSLGKLPLSQNHINFLGYLAGWTFVLASITDFFDGFIARRRNLVTVFGSFLDPVADKFLVVSSLILLLALGRLHVLVVIVLVLREMYITALRLLASERGFTVPVGKFGKWKTATQMIALPMLMAYDKPFDGLISFPLLGNIFISLACFFSLYSACEYSLSLLTKIKLKRLQKKEKKLNTKSTPKATDAEYEANV